MAKEHKVRLRLEGKDDASDEITRVQRSFAKLGKAMKVGLKVGAVAATAALVGLAAAIRKAASASDVQALAVLKLDTALKSLGPAAAGVSKRLQEQAAALQRVTVAGDEVIIEGQALIASFTKNEEKIKQATQAALDLSAATGTSLKSAFLLMGRAAAGETSTLSRYGITLEKGLESSEKFAAAVAKINEQFGGQAQARAQTYSGLLQQISNAYGDLWEKVGDGLTQNEKLRESMQNIIKILQGDQMAKLVTDLGVALGTMTSKAVEAATKLGDLGRGARKAAEGLTAFRRGVTEVDKSAEGVSATMDKVGAAIYEVTVGKVERAVTSIWTGPASLVNALIALGEQERLQEEAARQLSETQGELNKRWQESQVVMAETLGIHRESAEALRDHAAAQEELKASQQKQAELTKNLNEVAKKYGVTLNEEINVALEENARALDIVKKAMEAGIIEATEYEKIQTKITESTEKLNSELGKTPTYAERLAARLEHLRQLNEQLAQSTRTARNSMGNLGEEMDQTAQSASRAAQEIDNLSASTQLLQEIEAGPRRTQIIGRDPRVGADPWRHLVGAGGGFGGSGRRSTVTPDGRVEYT